MRALLLVSLLFLLSCGRPLTPEEKTFATQIHGPSLDTSRIRLVNGSLVGKVTYPRPKRPRLACRERILPEPTSPTITVAPAAYVIHNKVFFSKDWYAPNFLPNYTHALSLAHAMLFAHEITHVWQWQNRAETGYSPLRAFSERSASPDPYLYDINTKTRFLDYGFEQQASIVEEYVCCATLDPDAPRTHRLKALLSGAFPVGELTIPNNIYVPWDGVEPEGICRI